MTYIVNRKLNYCLTNCYYELIIFASFHKMTTFLEIINILIYLFLWKWIIWSKFLTFYEIEFIFFLFWSKRLQIFYCCISQLTNNFLYRKFIIFLEFDCISSNLIIWFYLYLEIHLVKHKLQNHKSVQVIRILKWI